MVTAWLRLEAAGQVNVNCSLSTRWQVVHTAAFNNWEDR